MKTFYLINGIINFLIFGYDIERDRDFMTWLWLLSSLLFFIFFIILSLKKEDMDRGKEKLPLSGGTMTGDINIYTKEIEE